MNTTPVKKIATVLGAGSLLLGAVVAAPAASAATLTAAAVSAPPAGDSSQATGARTALVNAWYEQFLGRSATGDAGSSHWVVQLRTQAPADVLAALLRTPEVVGKQVDDLYTTFLGRSIEGDPGADSWIGGIQRGELPAEWAEQNMLASHEYQRGAASSNPQRAPQLVVAKWYRDVLGRQASAGEVDYWSIQLEDQSSLGVLRAIWYSSEAVNLRVASHYRDYLQRGADSGEVAYWSAAEVESDVGVVIALATSAEYRKNAPTFLP